MPDLRRFPFESTLPATLLALALLIPGPRSGVSAQATLTPGSWMEGALDTSDPALEDGTVYDVWRLPPGSAGVFSLTVESEDFDPVVEWVRLGEDGPEILAENDDFPGLTSTTDSRVYVRTRGDDAAAELRIYSLYDDGGGSYRVRAEAVASDVPGPEEIEYGADVRGRLLETDSLMDGAFVDRYRFRGAEGDVVKVAMEADFDAYLYLKVVGSSVPLAEDDDALGGTDAYLEVELPVSARYEILATSFRPAVGPYRLRMGPELDVEPAPAEEGRAGEGELPPEMIITEEERDALVVVADRVANDPMGFSFPSPGADFALSDDPGLPVDAPYVAVWTLADVMETAELVVMAVRPGQEVTAQVLDAFTGGLIQSTGATVVEEARDWEGGQTVYAMLEAPDGSVAELRCTASQARSGVEDLLVCLIGSSTDDWSFRETMDGLEVR